MKRLLTLSAILIFTFSALFAAGNPAVEKANKTVKLTVVKDKAGVIELSEKDFVQGGKARYYIYRFTDASVRFMVLKGSDGVIRAAFDACDVCYRAKKGFHQEGDDQVCNNCGNRFPSAQINEQRGGCNPIGMPEIVKDGKVLISVEDLKVGLAFF